MNPRLAQIMRRVQRNRAEPAEKAQPAGDLAGAIEQLIAEQVEARVSEHMALQRDRLQPTGPRLRQMLNTPAPASESPLPTPRTAPPTDYTCQVIRRSEEGRIEVVELGGKVRMKVERDSLGRTVRLVEIP